MPGIAVGVLVALALPASARADKPFFDVRDQARAVAPKAALRALARGPEAVVDVDPVTHTPRVLARRDGALSGPAGGAAATIGLRYVREHLDALGLSAADLDTLGDPQVTSANGVRQVRWPQVVNGIAAADSELRVNVSEDGQVLNVLGAPAPSLPSDTTPKLDAGEAVRAAQDSVDSHRSLIRRTASSRAATYTDGTQAKLTLYAQKLAWRVRYRTAPDAVYDVIVDADTGDVLRRANLVKEATGLVWDNYPGFGGAAVSKPLPNLTSATTLNGPYVHVYSDLNDSDTPQASEEVSPAVEYPLTTFPAGCSPVASCATWSGSGTTWMTNRQQNAVQAFYLAGRFRDHLHDDLGFNDFAGDKLELQTDDTAATQFPSYSNANMYTPPAGETPVMQMYLWRSPNVNGGDDAGILWHEFAHGLTSRLVTDAEGVEALNAPQAGAMGEGFSDFFAKSYLVTLFSAIDTPTAGDVSMNGYVGNAIREQGLDCPVVSNCPGTNRTGPGGFTYGDYGQIYGPNIPELHADGEIWAETLWDLRQRIGDAHAVESLIVKALPLAPPEPTFLDMRNAILLADANAGGTYHNDIWAVFANRGMGYYASADDSNDTTPIADTSLPPAGGRTGTISGQIKDVTLNTPLVGATVSVGGLASVPAAEQLKATTGADGRYTLAVPPNDYQSIVVQKPGYEPQVLTNVHVANGGTATVDAQIKRDWASLSGGGKVVSTAGMELRGSGCGPNAAIDQNLGTAWSTLYTIGGTPKSMVVMLPEAVDLTAVGIDPGRGCTASQVAATANYAVYTGDSANGPWTQVATGTFGGGDDHRLNVVPVSGAVGNIRYVRLEPRTAQGSDQFIEISAFAVYGLAHARAPTTTILTGPSGTDPDPTPTFTFTSDQADATFECRFDANPYAPCTSPFTSPTALDGHHTFDVRAVSTGGQRDDTPEHRDFTIDATLPDTSLDASPPAITKNSTVQFAFSGTNATSFECDWGDGTGFATCATGVTKTLADGQRTFRVRGVNGAGPDPSPAAFTFTVDTTAPATQISAVDVVADTAKFTFSAPDATAVTYACSLDGATAPCTSPKTYSGLADGTHTFTVTATDAAGNAKPASSPATISVTPYDTQLNGMPPELVAQHDAQFAFSSPSAGASFECALDGAAYAPCTSPLTLTNVADGQHTFHVRAKGPGTRVDPTPEAYPFTVDTTPPETLFTLAPPLILTSRDFTFGFTASEAASFVCEVDGVPSNCSPPLSLRGLTDGPHFVVVTATDAAGNIDPTPARSSFTVSIPLLQNPGPQATPTPKPASALTSASAPQSASLRKLRKDGKLKISVRTPRGAKVGAQVKLGSRVLGTTNVTARTTTTAISLKLDKKRMRAAKAGSSLSLKVSASGSGLVSATRTFKVKLKL